MSTKESQVLIGRCGQFKVPVKGDLSMTVTILDVRTNFGRTDVLIQPDSGKGGAWVSLDAVTLSPIAMQGHVLTCPCDECERLRGNIS